MRGSYKLTYDRPDGIASDPFHRYIVLSFVNGTLVLQISEDIEEVQDTGFLSQEPTLAVQQIGRGTRSCRCIPAHSSYSCR